MPPQTTTQEPLAKASLDNTGALRLSKAQPESLDNPLAVRTWGATIVGGIAWTVWMYWLLYVYKGYMAWWKDPENNTLPDTSMVRVCIPIFLAAMVTEALVSYFGGWKENYRLNDTVAALSNGVIMQLFIVYVKLTGEWFGVVLITAIPYEWIYENYRLVSLEGTSGFLLMVLGRDLGYYWFHRAAHRIAFMWAVHGVHHRPNEFNYSTNLSQSAFQRVTSVLFYAPLALFFPVELYALLFPMEKLYGFFTHTRLVGNMYFFDWIFVTPSTHRVHHAGAPSKYLDKNYGEFLTIWDRMFGTFQPEEEPIVFGHVNPHQTWDPTVAHFETFAKLWEKALTCPSVIDKIKVFFYPPGWDPHAKTYTEYPGRDVSPYSAVKYDARIPPAHRVYGVMNLVLSVAIGLFTIQKFHVFPTVLSISVSCAMVTWTLANLGKMWDGNPLWWSSELARLLTVTPFVAYMFAEAYKAVPVSTVLTTPGGAETVLGTGIFALACIAFIASPSGRNVSTDAPVWVPEAGRWFGQLLNKSSGKKKRS